MVTGVPPIQPFVKAGPWRRHEDQSIEVLGPRGVLGAWHGMGRRGKRAPESLIEDASKVGEDASPSASTEKNINFKHQDLLRDLFGVSSDLLQA